MSPGSSDLLQFDFSPLVAAMPSRVENTRPPGRGFWARLASWLREPL